MDLLLGGLLAMFLIVLSVAVIMVCIKLWHPDPEFGMTQRVRMLWEWKRSQDMIEAAAKVGQADTKAFDEQGMRDFISNSISEALPDVTSKVRK